MSRPGLTQALRGLHQPHWSGPIVCISWLCSTIKILTFYYSATWKWTCPAARAHWHGQAQWHTLTVTHTHSHWHTHTLSTHTHTHTHTHTQSHTHTHTHTRTYWRTHARHAQTWHTHRRYTRTHTDTHTRACAHAQTHTHWHRHPHWHTPLYYERQLNLHILNLLSHETGALTTELSPLPDMHLLWIKRKKRKKVLYVGN